MSGIFVFGLIGPLGVKELILILLIALVIFGPKKLPEIGRSFGQMLSGFREGRKEGEGEASESKSKQNGDGK